MKKKKRISIRVAIATMLIGCLAVGSSFGAAAPKITDLSKAYLDGDLESTQSLDTIQKIDFNDLIITKVPDEKYEMFRIVLNKEKYPDLALSARRVDASDDSDDRLEMNQHISDVIKNGISHEASDYKANEVVIQFGSGTSQKMVLFAVNKERRIVGYTAFFNDNGTLVSETEYVPNFIKLKTFDPTALTFTFDPSDNSYNYRIDREKLDSDIRSFTYARGSGYGSGIIPLDELKRVVISSLKLYGFARPYSDSILQGLYTDASERGPSHKDFNKPYTYVFTLYDAEKKPMAYTLIVFQGYEVKPYSMYKMTDRDDYKTFSTSALTVAQNSKSKSYVIKIDKAKLPKEMQAFTKFTLNATAKNEFYGINKSFELERIASSKKYNYQNQVGFTANIDGKSIFCLQLFDDKNQLLGYVVFK